MSIIWGHYKGERGYWTTNKRGKTVFVSANRPIKHGGQGLQIIKDIEPFQNIAIDGAVIGGRRQKRDMMRAHSLIEVGNERPPEATKLGRHLAEKARTPDRNIVELIKKNSGGRWL